MLSTPIRRLALGVAAVSLSVPGSVLFDSAVSAAQPASAVATPDTEPPAEPPSTEAPAETQPPAQPTTPDDDNNRWIWFLALLAVLIGGVAVVFAVLGRGGGRSTTSAVARNADTHREQHSIMGTAQWFHDQLSVQLVGSPPDQALARWQYERPRVQSIAAAANQQAIDADDPWHLLANSVLLLAGALDTLLGLQVQHPRNDDAVQDAQAAVAARQRQLQALLNTMWPMVQTQ